MTCSLAESAATLALRSVGSGELDCDDFSALYFPERHRHDLNAVAAYGAYKQGRDRRNIGSQTAPPPRLTLVPRDAQAEAAVKESAAERLLVAVGAVRASDLEGGSRSR